MVLAKLKYRCISNRWKELRCVCLTADSTLFHLCRGYWLYSRKNSIYCRSLDNIIT